LPLRAENKIAAEPAFGARPRDVAVETLGQRPNSRKCDGVSKCGLIDANEIRQVARASRVSPVRSAMMRTSGSVTMLAPAIALMISRVKRR